MKRKNKYKVFPNFLIALVVCLSSLIIIIPAPKHEVMAESWLNQADDYSFDPTYNILATGDGSKEEPYKISSAAQLATVARKIDEYHNKSFELINNIDASQYNWYPIGRYGREFTGNFNGNNFTISGIIISHSDERVYSGLFAYVANNTIENVRLISNLEKPTKIVANSSLHSYAGGIAGASVNSTIKNCIISNISVMAKAREESYVGGIVGQTDANTTIHNCNTYLSTILSYSSLLNAYAGGIVGRSASGTTTMKNNGNHSSVEALTNVKGGKTYAGGITGGVAQAKGCFADISNCYNLGAVRSGTDRTFSSVIIDDTSYPLTPNTTSYAGGITGMSGKVSDCFNRGGVLARALQTEAEESYSQIRQSNTEVIYPGSGGTNINLFAYTYDYSLEITNDGKDTPVDYTKSQKVKKSSKISQAYAGGIMGFGVESDLIQNTYNYGTINGGVKEVRQTDAFTLVNALSNGYPELENEWLLVYYITSTYIDTTYYSDISGNTMPDIKASYGLNDFYDASRTIHITSYESGLPKKGSSIEDRIESTSPYQDFKRSPTITTMKYKGGGAFVKDVKFNLQQTSNIRLIATMQLEYYSEAIGNYTWKTLSYNVIKSQALTRPIKYTTIENSQTIKNLINGSGEWQNWEIIENINNGLPVPKGIFW